MCFKHLNISKMFQESIFQAKSRAIRGSREMMFS
jgi:hypothetical protein